MSFGTFLTLLDRITWKKLQKRAKNGIMKKTPFLKKNEKTQIFFLRWAINHPKIIKKSKFLCSITSHAPKTTEKNFHGHWDNIHEMKSRFLKKKHSWKNPGEVRIVADFKHFSTLHSTKKPWRPPKSLFLDLLGPIRRSRPVCHFWGNFSKLL